MPKAGKSLNEIAVDQLMSPPVVHIKLANPSCSRVNVAAALPGGARHGSVLPSDLIRGFCRRSCQEYCVREYIAGAESRARLSLANPFRLTRGDSVHSFDVSGILVGPEPDNPAGVGARFTRTAYDVAVGHLGFPQNHDVSVSQATAPFRASVGNYRVGQG
jgi:hypothetical protein